MMKTHFQLASLALAALLSGCADSPTHASPLRGEYSLSLYDSRRPPIVLTRVVSIPVSGGAGVSCDYQLVAERLTITELGEVTRNESLRTVCDDGRPDATSTKLVFGVALSSGGGLVIDFGADDTVDSERYYVRLESGSLYVDKRESFVRPASGQLQQVTSLVPIAYAPVVLL